MMLLLLMSLAPYKTCSLHAQTKGLLLIAPAACSSLSILQTQLGLGPAHLASMYCPAVDWAYLRFALEIQGFSLSKRTFHSYCLTLFPLPSSLAREGPALGCSVSRTMSIPRRDPAFHAVSGVS